MSASLTAPTQRAWKGPRGHWLIGCLKPIQKEPLHFYRRVWEEHGDYACIRAFPGYPVYLLADPTAVEHILSTHHKNYRKPDVFLSPMRLLAGNGILTSDGDFWIRQRRLSQPAFLRSTVIELADHMIEAVDGLIQKWEGEEDGQAFDISSDLMTLGLRIASTALFSTDISGDADTIGQAYRTAFAYLGRKMNDPFMPPLWMPTRQNREFRRFRKLLDRVVLELIESRRQHGNGATKDVLDRLLAAQDDETGTGMTDQQLKDEVITLLTAGHETAGAALSWAWYLLSQHPEVQESLHDEVAGHLQGRLPTPEDLPQMPLATAVFEEAMRLYPPAPGLPRETIQPDEINGYPLPAKAVLILSQWLIHRHPSYWDNPDQFQPERFLPSTPHSRPKFAYFPFGGGPRICIGNHFAMLEGPLVLAAMAQKFRFVPAPDQQVDLDPTFTLRPKPGVKVIRQRRRKGATGG